MKPSLVCSILLSAFLIGCSGPQPVQTKKLPKEFTEFGNTRVDNYYWLSNPADSAVIAHLREENAYTEAMLSHTAGLQKTLYDEMVARVEQRYESLPSMRHGYWYNIRYEEGKQYPLYCRRKGTRDAAEEIFLNVPEMAAGHQIFMVRGYAVSPDNAWLAYGIDTSGSRRCTMYLKNLSDPAMAGESIPNTSANYVWGNDNRTLLYVVEDHTVRPYRVMRHVLGTDPATDVTVYTERDSTFEISLEATRDNAYLFITGGETEPREVRYLAANHPDAPPVLIQPRAKDVVYSMRDYEGDGFFIHTNLKATNFRLVRAPIRTPGQDHWTDVIPHRPDALLEDAFVLKRYIVADQRIEGLSRILVIDRKTGTSHYVDVGEEAYVAGAYPATDNSDLDSIRYQYSSLTTPGSEYYYHLGTHQKALLKQQKVGGGYDPSLYETHRVWATSEDGTKVPITIVYKKASYAKDGTHPALLYAYGSYGANSDPYFNRQVISLLDRGFIYGIAHIRGGQEMGRAWYEDGKMLKKKNTFADFIACAGYLAAEKYTSSDRLFAMGGSAGGMLMGAITNMRPELFRGIIAAVPWTDVITDMLNPDLPLTTLEYGEWGNPAIREQYDYMLTWSPYDNVKEAQYPAILATGGLNDTQVPYYSPAKWVAKIRDYNRGTNPVLFKCNMGAGHSGESGRFEALKLVSLEYAFMLDLVGTKQ
jgi:oligopeptidase B